MAILVSTKGPLVTMSGSLIGLDGRPLGLPELMCGDREVDVTEDEDFALNSISAARARLWAGALEHRPNYGGIKDVDEVTSVAYYKRKAKSAPMVAGALHTILADGIWTPDRARLGVRKLMASALFVAS